MQGSQALVADAGNAQRTWPNLGTDQCQQVEQRLRTCWCMQWRGTHDRAAQALASPSAKQQQWQRLEQECTLAPDTRGADQDQCVDPGRPSQRVVQCQEAAERQAHECCAFHAKCVEDIIQPLRMRVAVQRRLRAFAEARFANDVDGMHAVVLAPTFGIEHPAGGIAEGAMQQHQGRAVFLAAADHKCRTGAGGEMVRFVWYRPVRKHLAIGGKYVLRGNAGALPLHALRSCSRRCRLTSSAVEPARPPITISLSTSCSGE